MWFIILSLIYFLFKCGYKEYKMFVDPNQPTETESDINDSRQEFIEIPARNVMLQRDKKSINDTNEIIFFIPVNEMRTEQETNKSAITDNDYTNTISKTGKTVPKNNVIPREKIVQICRETLHKHKDMNSNDTKDLNTMFQELSAYDKSNEDVGTMSSSTSRLDFYDVPQGVRKVGYGSRQCKEIPPVYKSLSASSLGQTERIGDNEYLVPLSGTLHMSREPTYINAHWNY